MNILVTGANGQLGSELRELSVSSDDLFVFTDVNELDLCNEADIISFLGHQPIDVIINCVAYTAVDKAETDIKSA